MTSTNFKNLMRQVHSSRIKYAYAALCDVRKKYMKDVPSLIKAGLVLRILEFVRTRDSLDEQYRSKVIVMSMSILGNLCMEALTRQEVLKERGIQYIVELYNEAEGEELLTRICRCLSNLLLDPRNWELVCCVMVIEKTVNLLKDTENEENKLTYIRAIRLLGPTGPYVHKLVVNNAVSRVMKYIDSESQQLKDAALRCIHSLSSHRCCASFASQVITSGKLPFLLESVKLKDNKVYQLIIRLCEHHCCRAEFGNSGGIDILVDIISSEEEFEEKWIFDALSVLCLCCKEAVNRVKLREKSVLPLIVQSLSEDKYTKLHSRIISALVCFLYDETGFKVLLENQMVPILIKRFRNFFDPGWEPVKYKPDTKENAASKTDFAKPESSRIMELKEDENTEDIPNERVHGTSNQKIDTENTLKISEDMDVDEEIGAEVELEIELEKSLSCDSKPTAITTKPVYSMHSPTYLSCSTWNYGDADKATCISTFSPPPTIDYNSGSNYSPLSNTSYYSASESSPRYFLSSPETSPNARYNDSCSQHQSQRDLPKYSSVVCQLYKPDKSPEHGNISPTHLTNHEMENYSPGAKSPSPSELTDLSEDPVKFSYSPVYNDSETDDEENDTKESSKLSGIIIDEAMNKTSDSGDFDVNSKEKNEALSDKTKSSLIVLNEIEDDEISAIDFSKVFSELDKCEGRKERKRKLVDRTDRVTEFNILILLSRVSQMTDPTMHLVTEEVMYSLLDYLGTVDTPLARCPRLLSRLFRNPLCFQTLLSLQIPVLIYEKILRYENLELVVQLFKDQQREVNSISDRRTDNSAQQATKRRKTSEGQSFTYTGIDHKQEVDFCEAGSSAVGLLEDFSGVIDSPYGRGVIEKLLFSKAQEEKIDLCVCLLYITWSLASRQYFFNQRFILDMITEIFNPLRDLNCQHFISTINGFRILFLMMDTKRKYQHSKMSTSYYSNSTNSNPHSSTDIEIPDADVEKNSEGEDNVFEHDSDDHDALVSDPLDVSSTELHQIRPRHYNDVYKTNCCVQNASNLDTIFLVGGEKVFANRSTLCLKSEIFTAMLEGHYSEASLSEIPVQECSKLAFDIVIHHLHGCIPSTCKIIDRLYTTDVNKESADLCITVLNEANKYMIQDLYSLAYQCLFSRYVVPESAFSAFKFAVLHRNEKLMKACVSTMFYDGKSCSGVIQTCSDILSSRYAGLFINTIADILLE